MISTASRSHILSTKSQHSPKLSLAANNMISDQSFWATGLIVHSFSEADFCNKGVECPIRGVNKFRSATLNTQGNLRVSKMYWKLLDFVWISLTSSYFLYSIPILYDKLPSYSSEEKKRQRTVMALERVTWCRCPFPKPRWTSETTCSFVQN